MLKPRLENLSRSQFLVKSDYLLSNLKFRFSAKGAFQTFIAVRLNLDYVMNLTVDKLKKGFKNNAEVIINDYM